MSGDWNFGLFGCFSNCCICIKAWFLPCWMYGEIAGSVGKSCCLHCLCFFVPLVGLYCMTVTRGEVREKLGIPGGCCGDFILSLFCGPCTLAQEGNELQVMHMAASMDRE